MTTIGEMIDQMYWLREEKKGLESRAEALGSRIKEIEFELIKKLEAEGVTSSRGTHASVTKSVNIVPKAENWDEIWHFILNGPNRGESRVHLIQKRLSAPACREFFEKGRELPGVVPVELTRINLRRV